MKNLLYRWLVLSLALYVTCVIAGMLKVGLSADPVRPWRVLIAAAAIGLVNAILLPLLKLFTLPLHCLTLGLSTFVTNVILFFAIGNMDLGIKVDGALGALFGTVCLSFVASILGLLLPDKKGK